MRKTLFTTILGFAVLFAVSPLIKADVIPVSLKMDTSYIWNNVGYHMSNPSGNTSGYIGGVAFTDSLTGDPIHLTYPRAEIPWSTALHTTWTGTKTDLGSSGYSAMQQAQIQSLFDHTYSSLYGSYLEGRNDYDSAIFSITTRAILSSTDSAGNLLYNTRQMGGETHYQLAQGPNSDWYYESDFQVIQSWMAATLTGDWEALGFEYQETLVSVYSLSSSFLFVGGTGTFFGAEFVGSGGDVVPEPATLAVLGLGLAGLAGVARARRRK